MSDIYSLSDLMRMTAIFANYLMGPPRSYGLYKTSRYR